MILHVSQELYDDGPENPYDGEVSEKIGFTAAAITQLCRELGVPIHIKWRGCKIKSYTPERPEYEAVALYIWGDHCYTLGDAAAKKAMVKEPVNEPRSQDQKVLASIGRRGNSTPAAY